MVSPQQRSMNTKGTISIIDRKATTNRKTNNIFVWVISFWLVLFSGLNFVVIYQTQQQQQQNDNHHKTRAEKLFQQLPEKQNNRRQQQQRQRQEEVQYHVIFSTGCSMKLDWQSYLFFHSAMKAKQKGTITRIVSGCTPEQETILRQRHQEQIERKMSQQFKVHFTPDYSNIKRNDNNNGNYYYYFNKPFGVLHWMEHVLGYNNSKTRNSNPQHDNSIIILCDPDQIMLRPFTNNFTNSVEQWRSRDYYPHVQTVSHGYPMAAEYGFSWDWLSLTNMTQVIEWISQEHYHYTHIDINTVFFSKTTNIKSSSPVETLTINQAMENYAVGPPYMATAKDFYKIVQLWATIVPHVHTQYPELMAEMYSYSLAAAHLELPHQLAQSFMLSEMGGHEAWETCVDPFSKSQICSNVLSSNNADNNNNNGGIPSSHLPHVLHYCQIYNLGKYIVWKWKFPESFLFDCAAPLLKVPPSNFAVMYDWYIDPFLLLPDNPQTQKTIIEKKSLQDPRYIKRMAFMLCYFIKAANDASRFYKQHHCNNTTGANLEETWTFFPNNRMDDTEDGW